MSEREALKICLDRVARKASQEPVGQWTDGDFIELSEAIEEATGILISRNTLKRLYNKMKTTEEYKPQKETRNALAIYLGYSGWNDFRQEFGVTDGGGIQSNALSPNAPYKTRLQRSRWIWIAGAILLGIVGIGFYLKPTKIKKEPTGKIEILNPVDTIPYNLKCRFSFSPTDADSLQLGIEPILPGSKMMVTGVNEPGYRWLILSRKGKTIASQPYHSISRTWMGFYNPKRKMVRTPLLPGQFINEGKAELKKSYFYGTTLDSLNFYFSLQHAREFGVSADDLVFETQVFIPFRSSVCDGAEIKLTGTNAQIEQHVYPEGCANHTYIFLPDLYIFGKYQDLTALKIPRNQWTRIRIETHNQQAMFFIDGKKLFSTRYPRPAGLLKSITLRFNSFARVDYVKVWDPNGRLVENEEFETTGAVQKK